MKNLFIELLAFHFHLSKEQGTFLFDTANFLLEQTLKVSAHPIYLCDGFFVFGLHPSQLHLILPLHLLVPTVKEFRKLNF